MITIQRICMYIHKLIPNRKHVKVNVPVFDRKDLIKNTQK